MKRVVHDIQPEDWPIEIVLPRLDKVRPGTNCTWYACCPAHDDNKPSLSIKETSEGVLLIKCHCDCQTESIMAAIGLDMSFLYPSPFARRFGNGTRAGRQGLSTTERDDKAVEPSIDYAHFRDVFQTMFPAATEVRRLAYQLGVPYASLHALRVGYSGRRRCWVFPERDAKRRIVGLLYRDRSGRKVCEPMSKRGLTIPYDLAPAKQGALYVVEGASDTAAMHSVGALAIGRPAAVATPLVRHWLVEILKAYPARDLIVIGDRDRNVGARGASDLAAYLGRSLRRRIAWALPHSSFKDVREQIVAGAWDAGLKMQGSNHGPRTLR